MRCWRPGKAREKRGERRIPALECAMDDVLDAQSGKLADHAPAHRHHARGLGDAAALRGALRPAPLRCSNCRAFAWPTTFLALRAASGEVPAEIEAWWRAFQSADEETRRQMLLPEPSPQEARRAPRGKKPAGHGRRPPPA
jgi:poly(A) polymerase